jgi:O-antigen ligase
VPLGLYALGLLVSVLASYEPARSARAVSELFTLLTLPLGLALLRSERAVRRLVDGLVAAGALVALYGLAQFLWDYGDIDRRIRGPFSHYMTFAGVLLLADLLLLGRLACGDGRRRAWHWLALAAINLALLGSLTRGAWVALALALSLLLALRAPRLLLAWPAALVVFVLAAPVPLLQRALSIVRLDDTSNYDRLCMATAGLAMVAERPLFGLGPELVEARYPIYRHPTAPRFQVPHLHNSFLQLAAERGLVSLGAYLGLMAAAIALALRRYRGEGGAAGPRADLHLGAALALVAFNLAGLFENNWGDTEVQRLALVVLALPSALRAIAAPEVTAAASVPASA